MQLSNICNYQYFIFRWLDCHVCRNVNCIFAAHIEYRNISIQKKTVSLCKTPLSYITPLHTLPLFCPAPCMPSPYSVPPHVDKNNFHLSQLYCHNSTMCNQCNINNKELSYCNMRVCPCLGFAIAYIAMLEVVTCTWQPWSHSANYCVNLMGSV